MSNYTYIQFPWKFLRLINIILTCIINYYYYPDPFHNHLQLGHEWNVFKYFLQLNINSLLVRIDELRRRAKLTNAAVIEISELNLDDSGLVFEIQLNL